MDDIEQLKLILEAANSAGEGAYAIALVYFGIEVLEILLATTLVSAAGWIAYRLINRGMDIGYLNDAVCIRWELYGTVSKGETKKVMADIDKWKACYDNHNNKD